MCQSDCCNYMSRDAFLSCAKPFRVCKPQKHLVLSSYIYGQHNEIWLCLPIFWVKCFKYSFNMIIHRVTGDTSFKEGYFFEAFYFHTSWYFYPSLDLNILLWQQNHEIWSFSTILGPKYCILQEKNTKKLIYFPLKFCWEWFVKN